MKPTLLSKFLFIFLLLIPIALATTTVYTDKLNYAPGETITISGTCSLPNVPVGLRALLDGETVWFDQATSDVSQKYSVQFVPPQKGTYNIQAACQGDTSEAVDVEVKDVIAGGDSTPPVNNGGNQGGNNGGGGGGGSSCSPKWQYSEWSFCDANLEQTRTATDLKHCNKQPKQADILRSCEACEESWSCGAWSECSDDMQTRDCFDDHACGTSLLMPPTTQTCTTYVPPVVQQTVPSKPFFPQAKETVVSFWDEYMYFIIGVPLGIIILLLLILLLRLLFKKKLVYDEKEVRDWVKRERAAGTMMDDVKTIIGQYTHWDKEKVERVVNGLK